MKKKKTTNSQLKDKLIANQPEINKVIANDGDKNITINVNIDKLIDKVEINNDTTEEKLINGMTKALYDAINSAGQKGLFGII